jgi:hypothetical protein
MKEFQGVCFEKLFTWESVNADVSGKELIPDHGLFIYFCVCVVYFTMLSVS